MAAEPVLSYVLTTRNKLPTLREVLERLTRHRGLDEEIVVVDGASSDGTPAYLQGLLQTGQIQQVVSEPDAGEAHGYNKGLLRARGTLVKIVTDDDNYWWPAVARCREFMVRHPEVDVLGSDGGAVDWSHKEPFHASPNRSAFEMYCAGGLFPFQGLGLMLRRSSLALTGLFDTRFVSVDGEYTYRLTSGQANLAWFTGTLWIWLINPGSNCLAQQERTVRDHVRLRRYYSVIHRGASARATLVDAVRTVLRPLKHRLQKAKPTVVPAHSLNQGVSPAELFAQSDAWLERTNRQFPGEFLLREPIGGGRFECRKAG